MLYKKNKGERLDMELFKNPTSEYRAAPFWSWNCKLDKDELLRQIEVFKKMGFGGFLMHSRSGLATKYLGEEFMNLVKACRDKAQNEDMLAWIYDEDRWPSGYAGGYVTKIMKYRQKKLHLSPYPAEFADREKATEEGLAFLLAVFDIELDEKGFLKSYKMIGENDDAAGMKRYAFVAPTAVDEDKDYAGWHNGHTPVDSFSKEAIQKFIDVTYETYKKHVGDSFDKSVPAIFTDEPQIGFKQKLPFSHSEKEVMLPWTTDFDVTYKAQFGEDITEHIPELFWDLPNAEVSVSRYRYHEHTAQRFTESYAMQCGKWCEENGVALTGHMMWEHTLDAQTCTVGEAMRAYEWFQIPGMDLLCDRVELTTAKQTQSAVHQFGKEAMLTELYGVTNWDFDFRGHKFQGDWQAALGATVRAPHLAWVSMKGSAKRDYPASISYQVPWCKEYRHIEDHFARLATVLSRGVPIVNVGVIHPIESYWLYWGPEDTSSEMRQNLDKNFADITRWLTEDMVEFDFISEAMLPSQCKSVTDVLNVGCMNYSVILVPACKTIRRTTFDLLSSFSKNGGKLIFAGKCPEFIDAVKTDEVKDLYNKSICIDYERNSVLSAFEKEATVHIFKDNGKKAGGYVHSIRRDGKIKWFFLAHSERTYHKPTVDVGKPDNLMIVTDGEYIPSLYNTHSGDIEKIDFEQKNGKTYIYKTMYPFDSLLLSLEEGKGSYKHIEKTKEIIKTIDFKKNVEYSRSEDNVLLIDIARYRLDNEKEWSDAEEFLKIDEKCRQILGFPKADGKDIQPWVISDEPPEHYVTLKFEFESETDVENVYIAGEEAEYIIFNSNNINLNPDGYYVDKAIVKYKAGNIIKGTNTLEIKAPITKRISLENFFILGDFDIKLKGCEQIVCKKSEKIGFSDITSQGMPFYGGNITYKTKINVPRCSLNIRANRYRGALIKVLVDSEEKGCIIYPPYTLNVKDLSEGEHIVEFVLYGNRVNTFGPLHDSSANPYVEPGVWYTKDYEMSYEYEPKQTGIISSPVIEVIKKY